MYSQLTKCIVIYRVQLVAHAGRAKTFSTTVEKSLKKQFIDLKLKLQKIN